MGIACEARPPPDLPRIVRAVELLRQAPNDEKAPLVDALEGEACVDSDACRLKHICVEGYRLHVRSLGARAALDAAADSKTPPPAASIGVALASARADLARSRSLTLQCADLEAALRRQYEL